MPRNRAQVPDPDNRNSFLQWIWDIILTCVAIPTFLTLANIAAIWLFAIAVFSLATLKAYQYRRELWKWLSDRVTASKKKAVVAGILVITCLSTGAIGTWFLIHRSPDGYSWVMPENRNLRLPVLQPAVVGDPNTLNLKDFFDLDFENWFRTTDKLKIISPAGNEIGNVQFRLMFSPAIGSEFVGLYVGPSLDTFEICKSFALHYRSLVEAQKTMILKMRVPGDSRSMNSDDMRFTGDAFLYLENPLSDEQKTALNAIFKKHGISEVSYRGQDWLLLSRSNFISQMQKLHQQQPDLKPNYTHSP